METLRKIWVLVYRHLYITYTNRSLLLIMLATPLTLATIIAFAFGDLGSGDINISAVPVAVVNQDTGTFGDIYVQVFQARSGQATPTAEPDTAGNTADITDVDCPDDPAATTTQGDLSELINATLIGDPAQARALVDGGEFAAAVIIPAEFSERLTVDPQRVEVQPVSIEVYGNAGSPISAGIVHDITTAITNQIATGSIAMEASIQALIVSFSRNAFIGLDVFAAGNPVNNEMFAPFSCAFTDVYQTVALEQQTVTGEQVTLNALVFFGASQAMFFMMFTANGSAASLIEEKRNGTLDRIMVTPTSPLTILTGKLLGTFASCLLQMTLLFVAFAFVGTLMQGRATLIWGNNIGLVVIVVIAAALSVSGLGVLLAALSKTEGAANAIGTTINMAMAVLGGAFFNVQAIPVLQPFTWLSLIYWGSDAFIKLSLDQTDIGLNVLVLLGLGAVMFLAGLFVFSRRFKE
jgi:ABC-type multidrug transport system permease subunit